MLKGIIIIALVLSVFLLTGTTASAAETISINDLIENSMENDGQTVTIKGEAIGEVLERGDHAWVNVSDGGNAIGIWMTIEEANKIEYFGDYKNIGDTIMVTGIFSRNCPEHGGDIDIHCNELLIISSGNPVHEPIASDKIAVAAGLTVMAVAALIYYFKKLKKRA